ncbi:MAG: hypothetical protein M1831_000979 [Alyxoria varia]|nr:MAG: hypothetical protein M1831_000979 [Alyxoria varia]
MSGDVQSNTSSPGHSRSTRRASSAVAGQEIPERPSMGNYQKLSKFMGTWPEMSIFRRFGTLQAQNLLFLQAELAHLEDQLEDIRAEQRENEELAEKERLDLTQDWRTLADSYDSSEEYQTVVNIKEKLREYNAALVQYHEICQLHSPTKHDLQNLKHWLWRPDGGDNFLRGVEGEAWDSERVPHRDLITTSDAHKERDIFSAFLADNCMVWVLRFSEWFQPKRHLDPENAGLTHYDDSKLNRIAHFIGTLIASMLPAMSIFVLYFVNSMLDRLCIIIAFSALFSFTLAIFTKAKSVEIFAATAAFASVQVVFVGTTDSVPRAAQ